MNAVTELRSGAPGLALASAAETRSAILELQSDRPMAILSTNNPENSGEEMQVLVKTSQGRSVFRRRFLIQLGAGDVSFTSVAKQGGAVVSDFVLPLVLQYS